jgi:adiponectin receptor
MNRAEYRMYRAISFIVLGLSAVTPFIYIAMMNDNYKQFALPTINGWIWLYGGLVYIGGALIYGFRIPEKLFPSKFDLIGASHQIFHIAVIGGFTI